MERRQQPRTSLRCQVYFICVSADGRESAQDIGVVRDISAGGLMLETTAPINTMDIRIIAATEDNQQMEAEGAVVYSMQVEEGRYNTGICFQSGSEEATHFVELLIKACDADVG